MTTKMTTAMWKRGILSMALGVWGCSSESSAPAPSSDPPVSHSCPVPSVAKPVVMHAAFGALMDGRHVASHMSKTDRAYALSLPGSSRSVIGHASSLEPCTGVAVFDPFCTGGDDDKEPAPEHPRSAKGCFRFGCAEQDVALIDVFVPADGASTPTTRSPFAYAIEAPLGSGTIECAENPWRTYRVDLRDPAGARLEAPLAGTCTLVSSAGERVDLAHHGAIEATASDVSVKLAFTGFRSAPVEIHLTSAAGDAPTGEATFEGRTIVRVRATSEGAPPFVWEGECAE